MSIVTSEIELVKEYRNLNLNPVPFIYGEKSPLVKWKQYQTRMATDDEIENWFIQPRNLAFVCGPISGGLVVLDCDDMNTYELWAQEYDYATVTVKSSKGIHLYFRCQQEIGNHQGVTYRGQMLGDIRGSGGVIIAPPSLHPNGVYYEWINSPFDFEIAQINSLADLGIEFTSSAKPKVSTNKGERVNWREKWEPKVITIHWSESAYRKKVLEKEFFLVSTASKSWRNTSLYNAALNLGRLEIIVSKSDAVRTLDEACRQNGLMSEKNGPKAVSRTIESGYNAGLRNPHLLVEPNKDWRKFFELSPVLGLVKFLTNLARVDRTRSYHFMSKYWGEGYVARAFNQKALAGLLTKELGKSIYHQRISEWMIEAESLGLTCFHGNEVRSDDQSIRVYSFGIKEDNVIHTYLYGYILDMRVDRNNVLSINDSQEMPHFSRYRQFNIKNCYEIAPEYALLKYLQTIADSELKVKVIKKDLVERFEVDPKTINRWMKKLTKLEFIKHDEGKIYSVGEIKTWSGVSFESLYDEPDILPESMLQWAKDNHRLAEDSLVSEIGRFLEGKTYQPKPKPEPTFMYDFKTGQYIHSGTGEVLEKGVKPGESF